jgi:serine/threonine protein kinase
MVTQTLGTIGFEGRFDCAAIGTVSNVASRLCEAKPGQILVSPLHAAGLVHKDIKPANILVNDATGEVRLSGFGLASHLSRERQAIEPPEALAGALAYMAPEQTGRMNRSIDSRSDLYALGITYYQMLTGALPFTADDPMEWVHCHLARVPFPASRFGKFGFKNSAKGGGDD